MTISSVLAGTIVFVKLKLIILLLIVKKGDTSRDEFKFEIITVQ